MSIKFFISILTIIIQKKTKFLNLFSYCLIPIAVEEIQNLQL